ncbi:TerC family protein, partial [Mycolicibacterium pulveris]
INGGEHVPVPEIPTLVSLGVIVVTLIVTTVASLYKTRVHDVKKNGAEAGADEPEPEPHPRQG